MLAPKPPRGGGSGAGAREDDDEEEEELRAWLIGPVFDAVARRTSFVVLDAARLSAGPVCEARLPEGRHVPWGLHGCWHELGGGR